MNAQNKWQLVVVVAMIWTALASQAADYFWKTDIGSGNWNDTTKWEQSAVPGVLDIAWFRRSQTEPFTVTFTEDASAKLSMGSPIVASPVVVTFDLQGHTLTHTITALDAHRALDWTIVNGTLRSDTGSTALLIGYYEINYVPKVTIGTNATHLHNGTSFISVGSRSAGELVVRDGGKLITQSSSASHGLRMGVSTGAYPDGGAPFTNYTTRMTVTGTDSVWSNMVGSIQLACHSKATAELNITDNGRLVHNGGAFFVGYVSGATAALNITSGGVVDARQATDYMCIGNSGTGTVTVAGAGSKLLPCESKFLCLGGGSGKSQGTLIIEKGGLVEKMVGNASIQLGYSDNLTGRLIVRDGGVLRWAGGFGAVFVASAGVNEGAIGELTVTGTNSTAIVGEFVVGQTYGNALVTVADGGTLEIFRTMYVGRINTNSVSAHNGSAVLVVTGPGSVLKKSALTSSDLPGATISPDTSLGIGGCGFQGWSNSGLQYYGAYGPGGKVQATIENGGQVEIDAYLSVYPGSTLRIDGGRTYSGKIGLDTNAVLNVVLRQGDANGTALMTATEEARIWGATLMVELGTDFTPVPGDVYTLIEAGTLNANINRFSYNGATLQDEDLIKVGGTTFKVGYTEQAVTLTVRCVGTLITIL